MLRDLTVGLIKETELVEKLKALYPNSALQLQKDFAGYIKQSKNLTDSAEISFLSDKKTLDNHFPKEDVAINPGTPEQRTSVEPMHTMATDIEKIHGYGTPGATAPAAMAATAETEEPVHRSSQDTALGRTQVADTPTYSPTPTNTVTNTPTATTPTPPPAAAPSDVTPIPATPPTPTPSQQASVIKNPATPPPIPPTPTSNQPTTPTVPPPPSDLPTAGGGMPSFTPQRTQPEPPAPTQHPQSTPATPPDNRWSSTIKPEERLDKPGS
jgi:hypothetical protein